MRYEAFGFPCMGWREFNAEDNFLSDFAILVSDNLSVIPTGKPYVTDFMVSTAPQDEEMSIGNIEDEIINQNEQIESMYSAQTYEITPIVKRSDPRPRLFILAQSTLCAQLRILS